MGAEDPKIAALRAAGHDEAADLLADLAWHERRAAAEEAAKEPPVGAGPPSIPLIPCCVVDPQAEADGRSILESIQKSGVGRGHGSMLLLPSDDQKGGR